jgi:hypothetical protein
VAAVLALRHSGAGRIQLFAVHAHLFRDWRMHIRILDLDGSVTAQRDLVLQTRAFVRPARDWGPRLRLACRFSRFGTFERDLVERLECAADAEPAVTFIGSGDFHHVSLAFVRRMTRPFNLLVLDKHPDWMRGVPVLHCGSWLNHAARLPLVRHVFHVGGDLDFDNGFRWLAPWDLLCQGRITVFPAVRRFRRGRWASVDHEPLRADPDTPLTPERMRQLLAPYRAELARWPLYVSLDKDALRAEDAVVNWDSGHLQLREAEAVLSAFRDAAGEPAGMDLVGDWSPVEVRGAFRRALHWLEHPSLNVDAEEARRRNERTNLGLLNAAGVYRPGRGRDRVPLFAQSKRADG